MCYLNTYVAVVSLQKATLKFYSFQKMLLSTIAVVWSFNQSTAADERAINTQMILLTIIVVKDFKWQPLLAASLLWQISGL